MKVTVNEEGPNQMIMGVGGVGVCLRLLKQKVAGSNPVVTNPERGALRSQLS